MDDMQRMSAEMNTTTKPRVKEVSLPVFFATFIQLQVPQPSRCCRRATPDNKIRQVLSDLDFPLLFPSPKHSGPEFCVTPRLTRRVSPFRYHRRRPAISNISIQTPDWISYSAGATAASATLPDQATPIPSTL